MSDDITRAGPKRIVASSAFCTMGWATFLKYLERDLFRRVVEEVVGHPRYVEALTTQYEYFQKVWPMIGAEVEEGYTKLRARQQKAAAERALIERRVAEDAAAYREIAEVLADALELSTDEDLDRIVVWIRAQPLPSALMVEEYSDLVACDNVEQYIFRESYKRVVVSRLPWLPKTFNIIHFLEQAKVGWYKTAFLYLWTVFGEEIREDHQRNLASRKSKREPFVYIETDVRAVLVAYRNETTPPESGERARVHAEYGLLLAAVREDIDRRVKLEDMALQNFMPTKHVPKIARKLLEQEIHAQGLKRRDESRFFSARAQCLIESCNQLFDGTLVWQDGIDERVLRQVKNGGLENWEVLLEFEKHAERWQRAYQGE